MGRPTNTPNGYDRRIPNVIGQDTTETTAKPIQMVSTTNYKEANNSKGIGGKHHGYIKTHGIFSGRLYHQYNETRRKRKDTQEIK